VPWNAAIYFDSSALTAGTVQAADKGLRGATIGLHACAAMPAASSARLAVLSLDALEKRPQRRFVRGVAEKYLIGQRQTFGRHHQGDDDLHTIRPVIARVSEAPLVAFRHAATSCSSQDGASQYVPLLGKQRLEPIDYRAHAGGAA
jgi:hypothetical protein